MKKLKEKLSGAERAFLDHACASLGRLLPHVVIVGWKEVDWVKTESVWTSEDRREIRFSVGIKAAGIPEGRSLQALIRRRKDANNSALVKESLDQREYHICKLVAEEISAVFGNASSISTLALGALAKTFDENIVSRHLSEHHDVNLQVADLLEVLHTLAEETYENKSLAFGCVVDPQLEAYERSSFPKDFIGRKKFKALSDGFRTAYVVSNNGAVIRFVDLDKYSIRKLTGKHFYPEWAEPMARSSRDGRFGLVLSRQGDILIFEEGTLRFTYRYGRWQYWNHSHLVNLLRDKARAQRVPKKLLGSVVGAIYRAAIDVSFRRSGALFVVLHNRDRVGDIVKMGDTLGHQKRSRQELEFDLLLKHKKIQSLPRRVMVELASLDGAIVLNNAGSILAYGAVLQPKRAGRLKGTEGSRTKAAIGASHYGLAVKVSSDGDITVFHSGKQYLKI